jgi:hypothetical protein
MRALRRRAGASSARAAADWTRHDLFVIRPATLRAALGSLRRARVFAALLLGFLTRGCAFARRVVAQEDALLQRLVMQQGPRNWSHVAAQIEGRSSKSCRLRCVPSRGGACACFAARRARAARPPTHA